MTEPVSNKVQLSGYTGLQAGVVNTPDYTTTNITNQNISASTKSDSYLNAGVILGGEANYKGTFARAEVGLGTAYSGKIEIGHSFDIGRNMGLELSAKGEASQSLIATNELRASAQTMYSTDAITTQNGADAKTDWKPGVARLSAGAKFTFGSQKAKFGIGFESGIQKSTVPNADLIAMSSISADQQQVSKAVAETRIHNKGTYYGTPTLSADIKLGKNLTFNTRADLNQGHAGIRWNF